MNSVVAKFCVLLISVYTFGQCSSSSESDPTVPSNNFTPHTIASVSGPRSVYAADVDDDGDMDVLSVSFDGDKIIWYENLMINK